MEEWWHLQPTPKLCPLRLQILHEWIQSDYCHLVFSYKRSKLEKHFRVHRHLPRTDPDHPSNSNKLFLIVLRTPTIIYELLSYVAKA